MHCKYLGSLDAANKGLSAYVSRGQSQALRTSHRTNFNCKCDKLLGSTIRDLTYDKFIPAEKPSEVAALLFRNVT